MLNYWQRGAFYLAHPAAITDNARIPRAALLKRASPHAFPFGWTGNIAVECGEAINFLLMIFCS
jgi:hypothetical protein